MKVVVLNDCQVLMFNEVIGSLSQVFALGEKFVPGDDQKHFCKPAGIAVTGDGNIFVADGYCNNRVIKFDRSGHFVTQWGHSSYNTSWFYFKPKNFQMFWCSLPLKCFKTVKNSKCKHEC